MKNTVTVCIGILLLLLFAQTVSASWAFSFVVYDGGLYEVTDQTYDPSQIGAKIGKVTFYTDKEGTYGGNFSNTFKKGTEYYAVHGVEVKREIAVKAGEHRFVKAVYRGEYAGHGEPDVQADGNGSRAAGFYRYGMFASAFVAVILLGAGILYGLKRRG